MGVVVVYMVYFGLEDVVSGRCAALSDARHRRDKER